MRRLIILAASAATLVAAGGYVAAQGTSTGTITQSGPGGTETVTRSTNGSQTVIRRSGNNSAIITQGSSARLPSIAGMPAEAEDLLGSIEDDAAAVFDDLPVEMGVEGGQLPLARIPIPTPRPDRTTAATDETGSFFGRQHRVAEVEAFMSLVDPDGQLSAAEDRLLAETGIHVPTTDLMRQILRDTLN